MTDISAQPPHPAGPRALRRWTLPGIGLLALVLSAISRAPFAAVGGADDGFYAEVAHLWRNGFLPYVHAFDVKPPGIFAVLALVQSLVGETNLALRLIGWASDAVTMTALMAFCQRRGAFGAGVAAALLYGLVMPHILDDDAYDLLIAVTSLAVILAMSEKPPHRRAIEAGLMIGAAGLIKQTAAFEGLAILVILVSETPTTLARLKTAAIFIACALVLPVLCALYFALNGGLDALLHDTVLVAVQRSGTNSMLEGIGNFLLYCVDIAPLLVISFAMIARQSHLPRFRRETRALGIWLAGSTLAVLVQHATFSRYIGPMLPPTLLLTTLGMSLYLKARQGEALMLLIGLAAALPAVSFGFFVTTPRPDMSGIDRITAAIKAARPAPDDRLYIAVASAGSIWIYVKSGLRAPTPFLIPSQQLCLFPNAGPARIDETLAAHPRFIIIDRDSAQKGYLCEVVGARDKITSALARDYHLTAQTNGSTERFDLYETNDAAKP